MANSCDQRLLRCYKEIYDKAQKNNIYLRYSQIPKKVNSVESDKFYQLLEWLEKNSVPSVIGKSAQEREMAYIYQSLKTLDGHGNAYFQMMLPSKDLEILATSSNAVLQNLYIEILSKSVKRDVYSENDIIFTKDNMLLYKMYKSYYGELNNYGVNEIRELDLNKQIAILKKYLELDREKTLFIKTVEWFENNGGVPYKERKDAKTIEETKIGSFWWRIKNIPSETIKKGKPVFKSKLSKEELKYLNESTDERLKRCYDAILIKAIKNEIVINYYPKDKIMDFKRENFDYFYKIVSSFEIDTEEYLED